VENPKQAIEYENAGSIISFLSVGLTLPQNVAANVRVQPMPRMPLNVLFEVLEAFWKVF
jgi:hypothetical protein